MSAPPEPPEDLLYDADELPPAVPEPYSQSTPPIPFASPDRASVEAPPPEPAEDDIVLTKNKIARLKKKRNALDLEMHKLEMDWQGKPKDEQTLRRVHEIDDQIKELTIRIAKETHALKAAKTGTTKRSLLARRAASKNIQIPEFGVDSPLNSPATSLKRVNPLTEAPKRSDLAASPKRARSPRSRGGSKKRRSRDRILHVDDVDSNPTNQQAFRSLSQSISSHTSDTYAPDESLDSSLSMFHIEPLSDDDEDEEEIPPIPDDTSVSLSSTVDPADSGYAVARVTKDLAVRDYTLAHEYYEISQVCFGGLHVGRRWYDSTTRSRPTEKAWADFSLGNSLASVSQTGSAVLRLLDRYFVEKPGRHRYRTGEASHEWDPSGPCPQGLPPKLLSQLCLEACKLLSDDPPLVRPRTPTYVLGDLHGNYKDLSIFARGFWPLGIDLCPAGVLLLGDYVDRGPHSVEVAAHVLALKLIAPDKVFMLRGNHEISELNGNVSAYGSNCFKGQCISLYGKKRGEKIWAVFNEAFRFMPVAAVVGEKVFCVHGGIPRATATSRQGELLPLLDKLPKSSQQSWTHPTIMDLLWADPATPNDEATGLPERILDSGPGGADNQLNHFPSGYAPNSSRGPFTCIFGRTALDAFLAKTGCSHVIRAHQPPRLGIDFQHQGRILTIFSSSHYCGAHNAAAAALIADHKIRIVLAAIDKDTLSPETEISH